MPDVVTIGETMLRLSPPPGASLEHAAEFSVRAAGTESNVAITLCRLGTSAGWISRLVDNSLGRRVAAEIRAHGVDVSRVLWTAEARVGTYFVEPAISPRAARVIYDRAHSAFAEIDPNEVDWAFVGAARHLHLTGITPSLSDRCRTLAGRAIAEARRAGITISFDINYRARLWPPADARKTLEEMLQGIDVIFTTTEDARTLFDAEGKAEDACGLLARRFRPRVAVVTDEGRCVSSHGDRVLTRDGYEVTPVDRIGAGDAFAGGFIHGWLAEDSIERGLEYGMAAAALKHTYHGDVAWITLEDVRNLISGQPRWR
ncbi:MAG: sugar kinase [bacterium]